MYCTPTALAEARLASELAQLATPQRHPVVDEALMEATLRGEDRSAFAPGEVAVADAALLHIHKALLDASTVVDGYLALRKPVPYTLPLNPVPGIVSVWTRWIARYLLHQDRFGTREETDPVVRDYQQAIRFLELTRDGKFSLGADDPLPAPSGGAPQFAAPPRVFDHISLQDFVS